jgi:hypothetical protein
VTCYQYSSTPINAGSAKNTHCFKHIFSNFFYRKSQIRADEFQAMQNLNSKFFKQANQIASHIPVWKKYIFSREEASIPKLVWERFHFCSLRESGPITTVSIEIFFG